MDGVERVMVLGILAVIVAILSFAWGAADDEPVMAADGGAYDAGSLQTTPKVIRPLTPGGGRSDAEVPRAPQDARRSGERGLAGPTQGLKTSPRGGGAKGQAGGAFQPRGSSQQPSTKAVVPPVKARTQPGSPVAKGTGEEGPSPPLKVPAPATAETYTVRSGDTLWQIAHRLFDTAHPKSVVEKIIELNDQLDPDEIQPGQVLKLPPREALPTRDLKQQQEQTGARLYTIAEGDSLHRIAGKLLGDQLRWKEIYDLNRDRISAPNNIQVGMTILLPES